MSGHSKWATIKRDKASNDAKKSKIFSKLSRAISSAAKSSGADPDSNPKLRLLIDKAREARMPRDNIEKAINKGIGKGSEDRFEDVIYEGFGPGGVAVLILALTDNKNRTVSEIRTILNRHGGSMGTAGSTSYIFGKDPENPLFLVDASDQDMQSAVLSLYDDLDDHDDVQEVYVNLRIDAQ